MWFSRYVQDFLKRLINPFGNQLMFVDSLIKKISSTRLKLSVITVPAQWA